MVLAVKEREEGTGVRAVERAVSLLFRLAEHPNGASLHQLAREVGVSKSTVHRLLATLEGLEAVEQDRATRAYSLGWRARRLGGSRRSLPIGFREAAQPVVVALRDATGESAAAHVLDRDEHEVVVSAESHEEVRRVVPVGQRRSLLGGAVSRIMLANLPPESVEQILARAGGSSYVEPTPQELAEARERGWTFAFTERIPGGAAIAAPVFGPGLLLVGSLSVSGPAFRFTEDLALHHVPLLLALAQRVSRQMGAA